MSVQTGAKDEENGDRVKNIWVVGSKGVPKMGRS